MESYKPGALSGTLFASNKKKKSKGGSDNGGLQQLFTVKKTSVPVPVDSIQQKQTLKKAKSKKKKRVKNKEEADAQREGINHNVLQELDVTKKESPKSAKKTATKTDSISKTNKSADNVNDFPFVHEALAKKRPATTSPAAPKKKKIKNNEDEENVNRPRRNRKRDRNNDNRTVFVGNCPLRTDKKMLTKLFKEYGAIESVRFRCGPTSDLDLPRRAVVITKSYHEKSTSYVGYVVFKEENDAKKALALNGHVLDGQHLRVDLSSQSYKHDKKRSVFVGNLPFSIQEEPVRSHFEVCGAIINVRVVRDKKTSLGKGFAYVQFESKDAVGLALKLNSSKLEGRQIRVMVATNKPKPKEEKTPGKEKKASSSTTTATKKISFAPSNATSSSFSAVFKKKIEKKMRQKKKKASVKKSDGLSAIFGDDVPSGKNKSSGKSNRKGKGGQGAKKKQGHLKGPKGPKRSGKPTSGKRTAFK